MTWHTISSWKQTQCSVICSCLGFALVFELCVPFRFLFRVLRAHSNLGLCPRLIENSNEYDQITRHELWNLKLCEHVFNLSCFNRSHKFFTALDVGAINTINKRLSRTSPPRVEHGRLQWKTYPVNLNVTRWFEDFLRAAKWIGTVAWTCDLVTLLHHVFRWED